MYGRIRLLLRFALLWFFLQSLGRLLFLAYQFLAEGHAIAFDQLWGIARQGLWTDASVVGFVVLVLGLLMVLLGLLRDRALRAVILASNAILMGVCIFVMLVDILQFQAMGSRIDITPFFQPGVPLEGLCSVPLWSVLLLAFVLILWLWAFSWLAAHLVWPRGRRLSFFHWWKGGMLLVFSALMFIPLRGGLSCGELTVGNQAFSADSYANQAAVNPAWNLFHLLFRRAEDRVDCPELLPQPEAEARFSRMMSSADVVVPDSLFSMSEPDSARIDSLFHAGFSPILLRSPRPHIVVVLFEELPPYPWRDSLGGSPIPRLDSLSREGLLFHRMYSVSSRPDAGLAALLSGVPALPGTSVVSRARRLARLPYLPHALDSLGYATAFYFGGDAGPGDRRHYLSFAGFDRVLERRDFPEASQRSPRFVSDVEVYRRVLRDLDTSCAPSFSMLQMQGEGQDSVPSTSHSRLQRLRLADSLLGEFVDALRSRPFWEKTMLVVMSTRGMNLDPGVGEGGVEDFLTPMVWAGGAIRGACGYAHSRVVSQLDIPASLLSLLGAGAEDFPFSRDVLGHRESGALVERDRSVEWIADSASFRLNLESCREFGAEGMLTDSIRRDGRAFVLRAAQYFNGL